MKGFYSRNKKLQFEERLRKLQAKFEEDVKTATQQKKKIIIETNNIRE